MSNKGSCRDNVCVESSFHTLKIKALQDVTLMTCPQIKLTVFEYKVDYNRTKQHSAPIYSVQKVLN
ncbi:hypothetical protein Shewana3_1312 [Shewanella sp. ANA-3]|uniref:hypothetical protein n=1 Tax=Shewanella bicestrii TaxID=2018305 RepID=UPI0000E69F62|nr:hypothetical protein Shewana3_1312 [Shewanella sp. ANA-3]